MPKTVDYVGFSSPGACRVARHRVAQWIRVTAQDLSSRAAPRARDAGGEAESKDHENVSSAMLIQGVLTKMVVHWSGR